MLHVIPLNDSLDTVKRLWLHPENGGATLQHFTRAGRVEIRLTAEELELVRTSCLLPDCDCITDDERWNLEPLPFTLAGQDDGEGGIYAEEDTHGHN